MYTNLDIAKSLPINLALHCAYVCIVDLFHQTKPAGKATLTIFLAKHKEMVQSASLAKALDVESLYQATEQSPESNKTLSGLLPIRQIKSVT